MNPRDRMVLQELLDEAVAELRAVYHRTAAEGDGTAGALYEAAALRFAQLAYAERDAAAVTTPDTAPEDGGTDHHDDVADVPATAAGLFDGEDAAAGY